MAVLKHHNLFKKALEWRTLRLPNLQSHRPMGSSTMPKLHFFTYVDNQIPKKLKKVKKSQPAKETNRLSNWSEYNKALITKGFVAL
ncbi:hypothetical protein [Runella sp. SP2]|uniref:hypothetical protein n=1 Tax=Runella sp. SP2 TaxID=2268026 RepID=UPI000F08F0DC|nr:hypothetical protein [Runella sp. SP2]AYQ31343.1 hypothetical protein DTQ70_03755 [Runella sp. SP2]